MFLIYRRLYHLQAMPTASSTHCSIMYSTTAETLICIYSM